MADSSTAERAIRVLQPGSFNYLRESVLNMRFGSNQIFRIGGFSLAKKEEISVSFLLIYHTSKDGMDDVMGGSISFRHKLMGYTGVCVASTQTCFKPKEPFTSIHLCVALECVLVHKDPQALSCLVPLCPKNNELGIFLTSLL